MPIALAAFFVTHYVLCIFTQTFFQHRYASHRMFTMSTAWERFFHVFTYVSQGTSFLVPRAYAIMHRAHHAYSDTVKDPHSPSFSSNVGTMMWRTARLYDGLVEETIPAERRFMGDAPVMPWLDRFSQTWVSRLAWGTAYTLFYMHFATAWWQYLLLPVHYVMGPIHGAIVNWCGHRYGYVSYDNGDASRNTLPVDVLVMGELYQNNHHMFAMSPNFASKWFEFDLCYQIMRVLAALGIIRFNEHRQSVRPRVA